MLHKFTFGIKSESGNNTSRMKEKHWKIMNVARGKSMSTCVPEATSPDGLFFIDTAVKRGRGQSDGSTKSFSAEILGVSASLAAKRILLTKIDEER